MINKQKRNILLVAFMIIAVVVISAFAAKVKYFLKVSVLENQKNVRNACNSIPHVILNEITL